MLVLIVEDEGLIAFALKDRLERETGVSVCLSARVSKARLMAAEKRFDFALLDVEVSDGLTFDFARTLQQEHIPYAFSSGIDKGRVPSDLHPMAFIAKPITGREMAKIIDCIRAANAPSGQPRPKHS